jgi:predicted DNA-binding transcriptional regulator AlpA
MPARTGQEVTQVQSSVDRAAYSVIEFARSHGLSRAHVYNLLKDGLGPRVMRCGRRTLISKEAAEAWRRKMETERAEAA